MQSTMNTAKKTITYEVIHMDNLVATVSTFGQVKFSMNSSFCMISILKKAMI